MNIFDVIVLILIFNFIFIFYFVVLLYLLTEFIAAFTSVFVRCVVVVIDWWLQLMSLKAFGSCTVKVLCIETSN